MLRTLRGGAHALQMITGDQLLTACHAARELGLATKPLLVLEPRANGTDGNDGSGSLGWAHLATDDTPTPEPAPAAAAGGSGLRRRNKGAAKEAAPATPTPAPPSGPPPRFEATEASFAKLATTFDLCASGDALRALGAAGALAAAAPHLRVLARVAPDQKQKVLLALRARGINALMCGDGTNDVGALKASDVGVALVSASLVAPSAKRASEDDDDAAFASGGGARRRGGKGDGAAARAAMRERQQKLEDQLMSEAPTLKLGDASLAAAFTAKSASVASCVDIILQGRCTLVTTIQMFKILALNCLVSAYALSVLHLEGVRMGDSQVTASGMATAVYFLFVSSSRPLRNLCERRPPSSVLSPYVLLTVLLQFGAHLHTLIAAVRLGATHDTGGDRPEADAEFEPSVANTVVWLMTHMMQVTTFWVNYKGRPHMEALSANKGLVLSLGASAAFCIGLTQGWWGADIAAYFELVPLPEKARSGLIELMVMDFGLCWVAEKLLSRVFQF